MSPARELAPVTNGEAAREWQSYLNQGLSQNARASTPQRGNSSSDPPLANSGSPSSPAPGVASTGLSPLFARAADAPPTLASTSLSPPTVNSETMALTGRENIPGSAEGLSPQTPSINLNRSQGVGLEQLTILQHRTGMPDATPANMMIADLSSARFSSVDTAAPASVSSESGSNHGGGSWSYDPSNRGSTSEMRPMRWILPWLWQMSQTPIEKGESINWELDLPGGDRLRLQAMRLEDEWTLDFAGSSRRLQRWLENNQEELASRLQRIIGKPVRLFLDPQSPIKSAL